MLCSAHVPCLCACSGLSVCARSYSLPPSYCNTKAQSGYCSDLAQTRPYDIILSCGRFVAPRFVLRAAFRSSAQRSDVGRGTSQHTGITIRTMTAPPSSQAPTSVLKRMSRSLASCQAQALAYSTCIQRVLPNVSVRSASSQQPLVRGGTHAHGDTGHAASPWTHPAGREGYVCG